MRTANGDGLRRSHDRSHFPTPRGQARSRRGRHRYHPKGVYSPARVADRNVFAWAKGVRAETITGFVVMFGRSVVVIEDPLRMFRAAGSVHDCCVSVSNC
jgi:hypothetical protein